jgi:hypothetical protein
VQTTTDIHTAGYQLEIVRRLVRTIGCIIPRMARLNILMDDDLAARLDTASDGKKGAYIARAVRHQLLEDELAVLNTGVEDTAWTADAEQAVEDVMFGRA